MFRYGRKLKYNRCKKANFVGYWLIFAVSIIKLGVCGCEMSESG